MRHHKLTEEHKVAKQIAKVLSDLTIDLDQVGINLARSYPNVVFRRLTVVAESAEYEKEMMNVRNTHDPLF